jgi:hypothetical protein
MSDPIGAEYAAPPQTTRDCRDPWSYVEINVNGDVRPCCVREAVGNLAEATLAEILLGEPIRRLRAELLTGNLDAVCTGCRQRAPITPAAFQQKIRALRQEVRLPPDFDADAYLRANPDVMEAGATADAHFLSSGYLEGRVLQPAAAEGQVNDPAARLQGSRGVPAQAKAMK